MSPQRPCLLALGSLLASACTIDNSAGEFGSMGATETFGESAGTSEASGASTSTSGDDDDASSSDGKLDLPIVDVLAVECESIAQTTEIEEGPADILVIADEGISEQAKIDAISNLLPYINHVDVDSARVTWIAGPVPIHDDPGTDCVGSEVWPCVAPHVVLPDWQHVEHTVASGDILGSLLDTEPQWSEFLRPEAVKHVWVYSSTRRDDGVTVSEFDNEFSALGEDFAGYTFHAFIGDFGARPVKGDDFATFAESKLGHAFDPLDQENFLITLFFDAVLDGVRTAGLACEYEIPNPPAGQIFEKGHVNVEYDDGLGLQTVGFVESRSDCAAVSGNGWYYDDPIDPDSIKMCPQTCVRFETLANASIEIVFGCATIPAG